MLIDMMAPRTDSALEKRLEQLTGTDGACCVDELRAEADALRDNDLAAALRRIKAMADENRLLALRLLKRRGETCGCELQAALGLTHATVSHHMTTLADAGLVVGERRGKWVYYALAKSAATHVP